MTTLQLGQGAPDFSLPALDGARFDLASALASGPAVVAFFKISCPVCQFAFPFLERMFQHFPQERVRFLGISQDDADATRDFCREFGISFPVLLDETGYPVSNSYRLTNVPTVLLVAPSGTIEQLCVGFDKAVFEQINRQLGQQLRVPPAEVFHPGELVPDYQPG